MIDVRVRRHGPGELPRDAFTSWTTLPINLPVGGYSGNFMTHLVILNVGVDRTRVSSSTF